MASFNVASVTAEVVPDARTFKEKLDAQLRGLSATVDLKLLDQQVKAELDRVVRDRTVTVRAKIDDKSLIGQGAKAGAGYGGAFGKEARSRIDAALRSLPELKIGAATTEAEQKVKDLAARLETLRDQRIGVDVPTEQALAEIDAIRVDLAALGAESPDITVRANTAKATAELASFAAYVKSVDAEEVNVKVDTKDFSAAGKSLGLLATSIITLGPALIPVAAGAAAAGGALVGMGAAGILAFKGIQAEIAAGTTAGLIFSKGLDTLKGDLGTLEATAASNILGPFVDGVASIQHLMPSLNQDIGMFAGQLGRVASSVLSGIISGFHTLSPLMVQVGSGFESAAKSFQRFASGSGLQKFGDYAASVLPSVVATLQSLGTAAIHIVEAFAPIGSTVLAGLKGVADVINSIPVGVLSAFATAAVSAVIGLKGMQIAGSVAGGISRLSVALGGAALSATAMGLASAGIGAALGIATFLWAKHEAAVQANKQQIQSYTDALIQSKGAIDANVRSMTAKNLQDKVSSDTLSTLHLSLSDLTAAALGNAPAMAKVQANTQKYGSSLSVMNRAQLEAGTSSRQFTKDAQGVRDAVKQNNDQITKAQANQIAYAQAMADTNVVTGRTASSTLAAQAAKKLETTATKNQTAATNALNQAMDAEISKQATLAGGQLAVDQALLTLTKTLKTNKGAMNAHTQAGIDDRQAILGSVSALQNQRDTLIKTGTQTDVATKKYANQAQQLLDNIKRQDGASSSAYAYAKRLLAIPKDVKTAISTPGSERSSAQAINVHRQIDAIPSSKTTHINVQASGALSMVNAVRNAIAALHDRSVTITTVQTNAFNRMSAGRTQYKAEGGPLIGPGTKTSDSIPIMGSNGEYMIKADAVDKYGVAFFDQLNAMRLASGGPVTSRPASAAVTSPASFGVSGPLVVVNPAERQSEREIGAIAAREVMWRMR